MIRFDSTRARLRREQRHRRNVRAAASSRRLWSGPLARFETLWWVSKMIAA